MKYFNLIFPLLLSISLSACSLFTPAWEHPEGKTSAEFSADAGDCLYQWSLLTPQSVTPYIIEEESHSPLGGMMANASIDSDFEAECLESKGWRRKQ